MRNRIVQNFVLPFITGSLFSLFILMGFKDQNVSLGNKKNFQDQWKIENAEFNNYLSSL